VLEWRSRTRLRKKLVDERTRWLQRVQATLFHHGISGVPDKLLSAKGRAFLAALELPDAARERIAVLTISRKLARRCFHTLRELGPDAWNRSPNPARRPVPPSPPLPDDTQSSGRLPQLSRLSPTGGGPPKTERPESSPAERPIDHHVAGPRAEHPDKPGHPRNQRLELRTPQPLAPQT
jgi:hypothetical protein